MVLLGAVVVLIVIIGHRDPDDARFGLFIRSD
jgi:hypothetical protein